jgi:glycine oxidase
VLTDTPVTALLGSGGRCTGVRTARGEAIAAGAVVLAAGAWSGPLAASSGIVLPMVPWRGQMLAFDAVARPLQHIVFCGELVLIPRPHGPLLVGTTLENVGFDSRVTLSGLNQILARAARVVPGLGDLPLLRTWAGLRPGTPDHLPYLGPVPGWEGLYAATGHGRKGIILAPITGELMARAILEGALDPRLVPFLPGRVALAEVVEPGSD